MNKKEQFSTIKKRGINYLIDENRKIKKFKPWLGDIFSFMYDRIMERKIFPELFNGDISKHFEILKSEFNNVHNLNIIEIATGSGTLSKYLHNDNKYTGIDISKGLLKSAISRFKKYGFDFEKKSYENGTVLYFTAIIRDK